jgi:type II secretion system protein H
MMEMMIVLVLIGLMASLAAPSWFEQMPRLETKAQVREVVSKLREARSLAISRKEPAGLSFNGGDGTWTVFLDNNPEDNTHNTSDSAIATGALGSRVVVSHNGFDNQDVIFNPDGTALQSGAICLDAEDHSVVYTIDILASTGRVRMVEGYYPYGQ